MIIYDYALLGFTNQSLPNKNGLATTDINSKPFHLFQVVVQSYYSARISYIKELKISLFLECGTKMNDQLS